MSPWPRFLLIILVLFLFAVPITHAAPGNFTDVDAYVEMYMARDHIPGASLTVTQGTEIIYSKRYGVAGPERDMTPDTPMFIGSQTKSFTALAVMQLVEKRLIDLNAPVQRYIPWFQVDDPHSAQITVRSLLNHSSGLSEGGYVPNLSNDSSLEEAVRDLRHARPTAKVGEKFQCFNPWWFSFRHAAYGHCARNAPFKKTSRADAAGCGSCPT